jgi:hypothetical protein
LLLVLTGFEVRIFSLQSQCPVFRWSFSGFLDESCRRTISPSCTKNSVRAIRFGNALRISQRPDPRDCEPKAFREASGIEQSSRRFRLFSSHASVIPVTIRAPALAQFSFERRLRAEGGPPQNCIIFDTFSKQDLDLLTAQRLSGQPLARRLFSKKEVAFNGGISSTHS